MAPSEATSRSPRLSAGERRDQLLAAALAEFARTGYDGTSTETIARRAGISHAYVFRLAGTKKDLFTACSVPMRERILETFRSAAATWREDGYEHPLAAMGTAYRRMLADRELLHFMLQMFAACERDDEIREAARTCYRAIFEEIERLATPASEDEVRAFVASGMLLNIAAAMDLDELAAREDWVRRLVPEPHPHAHPPQGDRTR
jgi:AcrR family transcriptional regulator